MCVMTGCITKKLQSYDNTLPQEQQCTLIIVGTLKVTSFDNKKVKWSPGFFGYGVYGSSSIIKIPAGKHTFLVNYKENIGGAGYYHKENIDIAYNFEAGQTYKMNTYRGNVYITKE